MKNLIKVIQINDGNKNDIYNGNRLYINEETRSANIISAFLNDGWELVCCNNLYTPSINQPGSYSFYLGGIKAIFRKVVADDECDNSEDILHSVLASINDFSDDTSDDDFDDDDFPSLFADDFDDDFSVDD